VTFWTYNGIKAIPPLYFQQSLNSLFKILQERVGGASDDAIVDMNPDNSLSPYA
ncbi:hypothetical protein PGTUg99_000015, partial [Puccinia graminis f. sp. tritici]